MSNWHEYFTYVHDTGFLIWKERPLRHFKNIVTQKAWITRYAGRRAGKVHRGKSGKPESIRITVAKKNPKAHRIIWEMMVGPIPSGLCIDHIDRNPTNNRLSNLRLATHAQNMQNKGPIGGAKGYFFYTPKKPWVAQIYHNGKKIVLGRFATEEEASKAYQDARIKYHSMP